MAEPLRVLIVDDSEHDTKLMELALKHGGFEVQSERVDTGPAVQERLARGSYDVVLSDHAMPTLSSLAVLDLAAKAPAKPPVIVVSGQIGEENLTRAFHAGAVDYVSKDHLQALLAPAVRRTLAARHAARELERANWKLRQQEKAAALRTFVMGVAHEINNPLAYMTMSHDIAKGALDKAQRRDEPLTQPEIEEIIAALDSVGRGTQRIAAIVRALRRVSRAAAGEPHPTTASDALAKLAPEAPSGIQLTTELRSKGRVLIDEIDLRDVVQTLLRNAYEACIDQPRREVALATFDEGRNVVVEVTDTGIGIAPEEQAKVFTPFYTTKHTGTGLSLSIAQQLIDTYGGSISFQSTPGVGTTFRVTLPMLPEHAPSAVAFEATT